MKAGILVTLLGTAAVGLGVNAYTRESDKDYTYRKDLHYVNGMRLVVEDLNGKTSGGWKANKDSPSVSREVSDGTLTYQESLTYGEKYHVVHYSLTTLADQKTIDEMSKKEGRTAFLPGVLLYETADIYAHPLPIRYQSSAAPHSKDQELDPKRQIPAITGSLDFRTYIEGLGQTMQFIAKPDPASAQYPGNVKAMFRKLGL